MDKKQAEAAARAMLEPGRQVQEERRGRQVKAVHTRREQHLMCGFGVLGLVVAVGTAFFMHRNLLAFVGIGAPVGIVAGGLMVSWRRASLRSNHSANRVPQEPRDSST